MPSTRQGWTSAGKRVWKGFAGSVQDGRGGTGGHLRGEMDRLVPNQGTGYIVLVCTEFGRPLLARVQFQLVEWGTLAVGLVLGRPPHLALPQATLSPHSHKRVSFHEGVPCEA